MQHYDGLTGGEAGSEGSTHVPVSADDPTGAHTGLAGHSPYDEHQPFPGTDPMAAAGPHAAAVPGEIPDPELSAGVHSITSPVSNVIVDHPLLISEHTTVDHPQPDHTSHAGGLSQTAEEWLGPAALGPALGGAGRLGQKWFGKRRLAARSVDDLRQHIDKGNRVLAMVEADELDRHAQRDNRLGGLGRIPGQGAELPVEVVGVDRGAAGEATVSVDDNGGPIGKRTVPLEVFEAAWQLADRLAYTLREPGEESAVETKGVR